MHGLNFVISCLHPESLERNNSCEVSFSLQDQSTSAFQPAESIGFWLAAQEVRASCLYFPSCLVPFLSIRRLGRFCAPKTIMGIIVAAGSSFGGGGGGGLAGPLGVWFCSSAIVSFLTKSLEDAVAVYVRWTLVTIGTWRSTQGLPLV